MKSRYSFGDDNSEWNFALMYYKSLNEIRNVKSKAYISGEMFVYRDCLEEIFVNISFKLTKPERKVLQKKLGEANVYLINNDPKAKYLFRKIDLALMSLMNKYNMIFPGKSGLSGADRLRAKYGLEDDKSSSGDSEGVLDE